MTTGRINQVTTVFKAKNCRPPKDGRVVTRMRRVATWATPPGHTQRVSEPNRNQLWFPMDDAHEADTLKRTAP